MIIKNISLKNFRNIRDINFSPDSEMNVICGENAQGKTNIIEAIWLLTGAKSFRASKDSAFIRFGEKKAVISSVFVFDLLPFFATVFTTFPLYILTSKIMLFNKSTSQIVFFTL